MRRIALLLVLSLAACSRKSVEIANGPVIIISIDTLRSDHLPAYGYTRVQTPAIDAFRRDAILFERAYSHCPLTLVSHATLFTGVLPAENGVRDNIGYTLRPGVKTLAGIMKTKGYATGGAVSAIVLRGETGINRGFDFWDDDIAVDPNFLSMGRAQRSGNETREIAQKWIGDHEAQPFLFFLHLYEPHTPYDPPEPFRSRYGATYDGEIAAADDVVGRFFDFLKSKGLYERSTIVLLSDHGEGLGDHGEDEHGILLYRESIQVPLMIKLPGERRGGTSIGTPVQLIDILPTIAASHGIAGTYEGRSLLADLPADRRIYSETYYPRLHYGWSDLHSLVAGNDHYIRAPHPELYDLARDPGERANVLTENRRTYIALRDAIEPLVRTADAPKPIGDEQAKQLAALGYIGSTVSTAAGAGLPDPKEHIASSGRIKSAMLDFQEKRYEDAVRKFGELLHENRNMLDIWSMDATALARLGRTDEAIAAAKEGLRIAPTSSNLALLVAYLALEQGDLDTAAQHARLVVADAPTEAHNILGQVCLMRKDYANATAEAHAVLGTKRDRPVALMLLGRIAMEQGRLDEALHQFDDALSIVDGKNGIPPSKLYFFRGDALARMGRSDEAERSFRKEIELNPADPQAYKNLILLLSAEGRYAQATDSIYALEKAAPNAPSYVAITETLNVIGDRNGARFWAQRGLDRFPRDKRLQALR